MRRTLWIMVTEGATCGWCHWPAGVRREGGEGRAVPKRYSSLKTLAEGMPNWEGCMRVPLRSKQQEVQSNEVSV